MLGKTRNFPQKSKLWTKIEILNKNRNVRQKSNANNYDITHI